MLSHVSFDMSQPSDFASHSELVVSDWFGRLRIWKSPVLVIDFNFSCGAIGRWEERPMFRLGGVARVGTQVGTPENE